MMARTGGELGKTERLEFAPEGCLVNLDAELLKDPAHKVFAPPSYDAVDAHDRTALNDLSQGAALLLVQLCGTAWRFEVDEPGRATFVEPQHPIPNDLKRHAAKPSRIRARATIVDRRQRQKPTSLGCVLARARQPTQAQTVKIRSQRNGCRHGKPPFATMIQTQAPLGTP